MIIKNIKIENLRNISNAELNLSPNNNIVSGDNGAGKTTLLEAIYLLARAKSFRKGQIGSQITKGQKRLHIFARTEAHKIGIEKQGRETRIRIDGKGVKRLSEVAKILPITLINPNTHRILEEGPEQRRRLLNWGVFHVEHSFKVEMGEFKRILAQRNNAIRATSKDISVWDHAFIEQADKVSQRQIAYIEKWKSEIYRLSRDIPYLRDLEITFLQGWSAEQGISDALRDNRQKDREQGYTTAGPHRAEVQFKIEGTQTKQTLSRGQQKILISLILIAQARLLEESTGERPLFLVDDIQSELDGNSLETICDLFDRQACQTIITSVSTKGLMSRKWGFEPVLFHVEQGIFR